MTASEQALCPTCGSPDRHRCEQLEDDLRWMLDHHVGFAWDRKGDRYERIVAIRERLGYYDEAIPDG